jgi:outer membrane protein assembly factor BamA
MIKTVIIIIHFFVFSIYLFAQTEKNGREELYPFIVDSVIVTGNDITEEFIILRELTFSPGDTLDYETANYNRERIYSLGIFNQVLLDPQISEDANLLYIIVEESWYIYPIPFVNIKERDWNKLSFGMYLILKNFRGRNETLSATAALGYDPTFGISYYNPNSIGNENIFFFSRISYSDISNKSALAEQIAGRSFDQKVISTDLEIGRRFLLFHKFALKFGFSYIETPFYIDGVNASNDRIDRVYSLSAGYQFDTRDLIQFPKSGYYFNASHIFKGIGISDINYNVSRIDLRSYFRIVDKLHYKMRFTSRFTGGRKVPFYDNSIIGLEDKIRGFFKNKFEGNHSYLVSAEMYYPIIEEWHINLNFIPIIPKQLLSYRFALYAQLFADAGAVQNSNTALGLNDFKNGYGAGITILVLPHYVARIEYAINELRKSEFIIDVGISF